MRCSEFATSALFSLLAVGWASCLPQFAAAAEGDKEIVALASSENGSRILGATKGRVLTLWDVKAGKPIFRVIDALIPSTPVVSVSADGRLVAASNEKDRRSHLTVWDANSGKIVLDEFVPFMTPITSIQFSSKGTHVAVGSFLGGVLVYSISARTHKKYGYESLDVPSPPPTVTAIAFSEDEALLLVGRGGPRKGATLELWRRDAAYQVSTFPFSGHVDGVGFSADGRHIIVGSWWGSFWFVQDTKKPVRPPESKEHGIGDRYVSFSRAADRAFGCCESRPGLVIWAASTGAETSVIAPSGENMIASSDGSIIATSASDKISVWDGKSGSLIKSFPP